MVAVKTKVTIIAFLLLSSLFGIYTGESTTIYVDDDNPSDYSSIQAAINASSPGDIIYVHQGIYEEHLFINKPITLRGENGAIIRCVEQAHGIVIISDGVEIDGFKIEFAKEGYYALKLYNVKNCIIKNCNFSSNYGGIYIYNGQNNTIMRNTFFNNSYGITAVGIETSIFKENTFIKNTKAIDFGSNTRYNVFFYNNFIENTLDAYDESTFNQWYYENVGNYWDKYTGEDKDGDGIGDDPYPIEPLEKGNFDYYPLMENYTGIDIFPPDIIDLKATPQIQEPGGFVNISCKIVDNVGVNCTYLNITFPDGDFLNVSLNNINFTDIYYYNSSFSQKGTYYYYVWANDTNNNSEKTDRQKFVIAHKPVAQFSYEPLNPTRLDIITFDACDSYDIDGYIINYTWNFGDGSIAYGKIVQHQYSQNTTYTVTLTVYDNDGAWDSISKNIIIRNIPPVANFSMKSQAIVGEVIYFNDSSYDEDGEVRIWEWDFGDGIVLTGGTEYKNVTHVYKKNGVFNVTLTVWDNDYANDSITKQIVVVDIYPPRIENLTAHPNPQEINEYVNISCDIFDDVNVSIARINITLPNGSYINESMIKGTKYYYRIFCSLAGNYSYYVWTVDSSNNTNKSAIKTFEIIVPPAPPSIENISYLEEQQYGYFLNISCNVYDNVGVLDVRINITLPSGGYINESMEGITDDKGNGIYYYNSTFEMGLHKFYIYAEDINANGNRSANYTFNIIDTLPPLISNVSYPDISFPGIINISSVVTDNREISYVCINITLPSGGYINESMIGNELFYVNILLNQSGKHYFYIYAVDLTNNSASSPIYNFTINFPPIANFTFTPSLPYAFQNITFNASLSYDTDGYITTYKWDFNGDGIIDKETNESIVTYSYNEDGKYNVSLIVEDNDGFIANITKEITVMNNPPIANFSFNPSMLYAFQNITFNANSSYDIDGYIINYTWNFGDGNIAYGIITKHVYNEDGVYNVTLLVKDNDNAIANITKQIFVRNNPPIANFTYVIKNFTAYFYDSSYDIDGYIINYTWNFGDGSISYEKNPVHNYSNYGSYYITLFVKDNDGGIANITKEIFIGSLLLANFSWEPSQPVSKEEIQFIDTSLNAKEWHWNFGDNTTSNEQNPIHTYAIGNYYNVTLTIYNGSLNASITKEIRVDTKILVYKNANNVVNYIPWLSNSINASELALLIGEDIMPTGSVISKWNVSKGAFDSYIVGISPSSYDFVISPYDVVVLRVATNGSFVEEAIKLMDRIVELYKNANNIVNHIVWSCLYSINASELALLIGEDIMPTGSVISKWNVSKGAFDSYIVGISPSSYDFVISPGDCIVLRVANSGSFVMEVMK